LVAVAAGSLFALLPSRPVHLGAGVVFLVSAGVMIARKDDGPGTPQTGPGGDVPSSVGAFWRSFGTVFGVVFAAEWGDLTQLATAAFAARERMPVVIFCAATLALWAVTAIAVGLGNRAARVIRPVVAQRVAAALFAAIGVGLLVRG
jgi:putative Ca2+/H+ antiporter (TMEM165/GDT1 family)